MSKKILFLTGTRADFGKIKPLAKALEKQKQFAVHMFVTGMHMLPRYGYTGEEVRKSGFKNIYYFINQRLNDTLDTILSNTIIGLGNYLTLLKPDMIIVHGDRVEALAGAITGALNNFLVAHIEGGEVSGTIDESIRHSVSKLAHIHFVSNQVAGKRLLRMGENKENIFVIGSPDVDLMLSPGLPSIDEVKKYYDIPFRDNYSILIYHPVVTKIHDIMHNFKQVMQSVSESAKNYVVIYPNNDPGGNIIIEELALYASNPRIKIFPSIRFEYFLTLLKNCEFIIGNSSAGIREAPIYGVPTINLGTRQTGRFKHDTIININESKTDILKAIGQIKKMIKKPSYHFGTGKSTDKFLATMKNASIWKIELQKYFIDLNNY
ncbi:MAG: UDP-N-acetylglucosamine 2-epimerase (hydrolyzing) [Elusimicrobia bacterium HGW-Elusimicrobia-1]|jgi:UDP-N-acetylglucosamine 2-epimerase (hydrolysing)|nr:MAG: UDP-N-acetylglucosamine 2-epimerase (hydrolyzing) [Elusimicrobia bacterium HGW-Elusimicrobia-1]